MTQPMKEGERVNSLVRGLEVLKSFGKYREPMTITEVAKEVGMPPAAARRMLLTLTELGYVEQHGKRFRVGPRVLDLGYSYISSMPLWQIAQPVLERLSDKYQVSCAAAVLDGTDALYAIRANSHHPSSILVSTGTRLPAHVTAIGRVLMAHVPVAQLASLLEQIQFSSLTDRSVANATQLQKLLERVRRDGYSMVDEEMFSGLRAVAVPLKNKRDEVVASINACGNRNSIQAPYLVDTVLPALRSAADEIRAMLPA